jgi:hypothetical protein
MRDYLRHLNIVGAVSVYQEGEVCRWGIDSLLQHCDKVMICEDNSDEKTKIIVNEYQTKYPDRIVVGQTNLPPAKEGELLRARHKKYYGEIAQAALDMVKVEHKNKPVDLLIKIDSDEMLTNHFSTALTDFVNSDKDVLFICPMGVIDSLYVIANRDLFSHARVYKFVEDISSLNYSQQDFYLPYRRNRNIVKLPWNYLHMGRFTKESREWRQKVGNQVVDPETKMWRINKPAYDVSPNEYEHKVRISDKFVRFKNYNGDVNSIPLTEI